MDPGGNLRQHPGACARHRLRSQHRHEPSHYYRSVLLPDCCQEVFFVETFVKKRRLKLGFLFLMAYRIPTKRSYHVPHTYFLFCSQTVVKTYWFVKTFVIKRGQNRVSCRVADPDPNWIRIQSGQWILIRIWNPDPY
jgi:hypothetical protein